VVIVDSDADRAARLAADLNLAGAMRNYAPSAIGSDGLVDVSGSEIVVVTPDTDHLGGVAEVVRDRAPNATVVAATDPVEPACHLAYEVTVFARERIVGVAASVHSAAFRVALARELGVSVRDVAAVVLGGQGGLVPVLSCATVAGVPVSRRMSAERLEEIAAGIRDAPDRHPHADSPWVATSAAVLDVADAIVRDQRRVLPCAAQCKGEYGFEEVFVGLPVKLGAGGIREIVELDLDDDERAALRESAKAVEQAVADQKQA
jgi:malate dehydrogenase